MRDIPFFCVWFLEHVIKLQKEFDNRGQKTTKSVAMRNVAKWISIESTYPEVGWNENNEHLPKVHND